MSINKFSNLTRDVLRKSPHVLYDLPVLFTHPDNFYTDVDSRYSIPAIDAINTYYNHPDIPFAQSRIVSNDTAEPAVHSFTTPVFITTLANATLFPENVHGGSNKTIRPPLEFYHSILSQAEDKSVTILGIGFWNNLDELDRSNGGKELIERKVAELVVPGGDFSLNTSDPRPHGAGYNLGTSLHC